MSATRLITAKGLLLGNKGTILHRLAIAQRYQNHNNTTHVRYKGDGSMKSMSSDDIRNRFIKYFVGSQGNKHYPSSNIIPSSEDKSLLFTNAGMVQFKELFRDPRKAKVRKIVTVQKCLRAGGKHNDLDEVGESPRHHTFFEMLGNFSFGGEMSKADMIKVGWKFLVDELQLPVERLRVTVLETDDEAFSIWRDVIGLPEEKIIRKGREDNFWSMSNDGDGPCGPCTEVFWDTRDPMHIATGNDEERWLEIWNIVFMQYYGNGSSPLNELAELDDLCIDTGMGLERIASVMQGVESNFDTDTFRTIIRGIETEVKDVKGISLVVLKRIVADHLRASSFLISEGVIPSNTGRGYVLRRIIRRAIRAINQIDPSGKLGFSKLHKYLVESMGKAYPQLVEKSDIIVQTLRNEEQIFLKTLNRGVALLESILADPKLQKANTITAESAYLLYDTHGFPVDLTSAIAKERGWSVDVDGFERIREKSRQLNAAKSSSSDAGNTRAKVGGGGIEAEIKGVIEQWQNGEQPVSNAFSGYNTSDKGSTVPSYMKAFKALSDGKTALAVLDPCPFYPTSGGQVSDKGLIITSPNENQQQPQIKLHVTAVDKVKNAKGEELLVARVGVNADSSIGKLENFGDLSGTPFQCELNEMRRRGCRLHHTATHIIHAALRAVLGPSVRQAGSLIEPSRLRFDFSHTTGKALSKSQLQEVEDWANRVARADHGLVTEEMALNEAKAIGALGDFTEKYDETGVRVVQIPGVSKELCGGLHLRTTRDAFPIKIVSEQSIAAGVRRIEALAGEAAIEWYQRRDAEMVEASRVLDRALGSGGKGDLAKNADKVVERCVSAEGTAKRWAELAADMAASSSSSTTVRVIDIPAWEWNSGSACRLRIYDHSATIEPPCGDAKWAEMLSLRYKANDPLSAHLVIKGQMVALSLDPAGLAVDHQKEPHAGTMLRGLFQALGCSDAKGGGQASLAKGKLNAPPNLDLL